MSNQLQQFCYPKIFIHIKTKHNFLTSLFSNLSLSFLSLSLSLYLSLSLSLSLSLFLVSSFLLFLYLSLSFSPPLSLSPSFFSLMLSEPWPISYIHYHRTLFDTPITCPGHVLETYLPLSDGEATELKRNFQTRLISCFLSR